MDNRITLISNPVEEEYDLIRKKYWNKWVAIYQPDHMLAFKSGTVVAYADASEDDDIQWVLQEILNDTYDGGAVKQFIDEDMEECYVIFRDVRSEI